MSELNYVKSEPKEHILKSEIYEVQSYFNDPDLMDIYKRLKANVIDINGSSIVKTVQGTEQDFLEMMKLEIVDVIKKYIDVDETDMDVKLENRVNDDGTSGAPALYANIPIVGINDEKKKESIEIEKAKQEEADKKAENELKNKEETKKKVTAKKADSSKKTANKTEKNKVAKSAKATVEKVVKNARAKVESKKTGNNKKNIIFLILIHPVCYQ